MNCLICGTGKLVAATRDMPYTYKGRKTVIKAVRGQFCDNRKCGEVVLGMDESVRTSREMLEFNKKVNAGLSPIDLLTQVRQRLNITQQQAARVFGGGPNAFSRYESGKTKPPVALVKLFQLLDRHPEFYGEIAGKDERRTSKPSRVAASARKRRAPARSAHA
jgi:HTH-type transcriptional regulator / antitoxin MqsA